MLSYSVILFCLAGLGIVVMALRYGLAEPPLEYHAEMFRQAGAPPHDVHLMLIGGLYRVIGAAMFSFAIFQIGISLGPIANGEIWARWLLLITGLVLGIPSVMVSLEMERITKVNTPWRIAAGLLVLTVLAFVLSWF